MKRQTLLSFACLCVALNCAAQKTPMEKYEWTPSSSEHVFLDHVQNHPCRIIDIGPNQYLGQVDKDSKLYGYGMFINGDGSQIIGKFRNGELLFGITLTQNSALVGDRSNYASYSLTTGRIEYVFHANERVVVDTQRQLEYGFVSMKYANGDQYTGEVYQHKRHGYGIYYYRNGDFWFGQYNNDIRTGFGALFHVEGGLEIGEWKGEDEVRVIGIKAKK
ncbi:MAG: hypothetical protein IJ762_09415 [Bacteroidaceae bacterium]|nr:hypothetical protein [Bacteroidaceae bacterium]MBR1789388.1 hypothetical protein [Bacteroidaceae bacterium]